MNRPETRLAGAALKLEGAPTFVGELAMAQKLHCTPNSPLSGINGIDSESQEIREMINASEIKAKMPVLCSKNAQLGIVDHMEGSGTVKLTKDKAGQHHYIPLSWVKTVDANVHIDRPGDQAMREWSTSPPKTKI